MKKVYFSGAIRGGREHAPLYRAAIAALQARYQVLTEHIGEEALTALGQTALSDQEIYKRDIAWLTQCDFIVADCSAPSLGVGYELGYGEALHKPIYILYHAAAPGRLSAMVAGNPRFTLLPYKDKAALLSILSALPE